MKSFAKLAIAGVSGLVLFKLLASIIFPMFGLMLGLLALTVKVALIAAIAFFVYEIFFKKKNGDDGKEPGDEGEIVVEPEVEDEED